MNWKVFFFTIAAMLIFALLGWGFLSFTFWLTDQFGRTVGFVTYAAVVVLGGAALAGWTASDNPNDTGPR